MSVRFTPTPVPTIEDKPLMVYLDEQFRAVESAQPDELVEGRAINFGVADNVAANDTTETPILNYTDSFNNAILVADPVLGTITVPDKIGIVRLTTWASINQTGNSRDFTVQLVLEANGSWSTITLASGYIAQGGGDVNISMSASLVRSVAGGEVFRLGLILDGTGSATFEIQGVSFEMRYLTIRG